MLEWITLNNINQLTDISRDSYYKYQLIFKHSTRCSISALALDRLNREWHFDSSQITPYYLDLLQYRDISNKIAEKWQVQHQSPQILIIRNDECIYDATHNQISVKEIRDFLTQ
ncbi:MAG: bacillithiol system redox-active protein YtxJ [Bacteroidia bacterium]|nr:bacillithiol system redox-active protein YtxJ [Bacteroidia bacterium]